jgi:XTP/dITP diphosphohydrolase
MKLVFATHNPNKAAEIQKLMPATVEILTLDDLGLKAEIPEVALTLEGNALIKARYVWAKYKIPCFSDDTGLEIEALNGAPGVFSARYAGSAKNADENMNLVLKKLDGHANRKARFRTVIALVADGKEHIFVGIADGEITHSKSGTAGFGYDPIFKPVGSSQTFSEMSMDEKNAISHRARAVNKLVEFISTTSRV